MLGLFAVPMAAFIGALGTVFIVYELARVGRALPVTNLILAGVAVSSFATAADLFPDDQCDRRAAPRAGLVAGRFNHERLAAGLGAAALCRLGPGRAFDAWDML